MSRLPRGRIASAALPLARRVMVIGRAREGATTASALVTATTSLAARARAPRGARNAGQPADRSAHLPHRRASGAGTRRDARKVLRRAPIALLALVRSLPPVPRRNDDIVIPPEPPERGHDVEGPAGSRLIRRPRGDRR